MNLYMYACVNIINHNYNTFLTVRNFELPRFEDVVNVVLPSSSTIQLNLRTKSLIFQATRVRVLPAFFHV